MAKATICSVTLGLVGTALAGSARADYGPGGYASTGSSAGQGDVVGVGSDTVQNIGNFLTDGDTTGDAGYNAGGGASKFVSFDATPDANDRAAYGNPSTVVTPTALNPTIVLRGGTNPVQRPNGSGAGIAALLADNNYPTSTVINYVRASRLPKCTENSTAVAEHFGGLHVVQVATDPLEFATLTSSNAPTGFTITEAVSVYSGTITKWNQLPGNSGGSPDTIIPLIPQSGSGTGSTFIADLKAANGNVTVPLNNPNLVVTEENDPFAIVNASTPADAISPFSGGRLNLYASGYFHDPTTAFPGGAALNPAVKIETATAPDGHPSYDHVRGLYYIFRDADKNAGPWQPGGTKNWVNTLFVGSNSLVAGFAGQPNIAAAGVTPLYADLGFGVSGVSCT